MTSLPRRNGASVSGAPHAKSAHSRSVAGESSTFEVGEIFGRSVIEEARKGRPHKQIEIYNISANSTRMHACLHLYFYLEHYTMPVA